MSSAVSTSPRATAVVRSILLHSPTGGVGQTTAALNLAAACAQVGEHVLLVELGTGGSLSAALDLASRTDLVPAPLSPTLPGLVVRKGFLQCLDLAPGTELPAATALFQAAEQGTLDLEYSLIVFDATHLTMADGADLAACREWLLFVGHDPISHRRLPKYCAQWSALPHAAERLCHSVEMYRWPPRKRREAVPELTAETWPAPFTGALASLHKVPFDPEIRTAILDGVPGVLRNPASPAAVIYRQIALALCSPTGTVGDFTGASLQASPKTEPEPQLAPPVPVPPAIVVPAPVPEPTLIVAATANSKTLVIPNKLVQKPLAPPALRDTEPLPEPKSEFSIARTEPTLLGEDSMATGINSELRTGPTPEAFEPAVVDAIAEPVPDEPTPFTTAPAPVPTPPQAVAPPVVPVPAMPAPTIPDRVIPAPVAIATPPVSVAPPVAAPAAPAAATPSLTREYIAPMFASAAEAPPTLRPRTIPKSAPPAAVPGAVEAPLPAQPLAEANPPTPPSTTMFKPAATFEEPNLVQPAKAEPLPNRPQPLRANLGGRPAMSSRDAQIMRPLSAVEVVPSLKDTDPEPTPVGKFAPDEEWGASSPTRSGIFTLADRETVAVWNNYDPDLEAEVFAEAQAAEQQVEWEEPKWAWWQMLLGLAILLAPAIAVAYIIPELQLSMVVGTGLIATAVMIAWAVERWVMPTEMWNPH